MSFGGQPPAYTPPPAAGDPSRPPGAAQPVYGEPPRPVYGQPPAPPRAVQVRAEFASPFDRAPAYAPPAPQAPSPAPAMPALPVPVRKGRSASIWAFGVLGFLMLGLAAYFVFALGAGASITGMILALIPLAIVLTGVHLIDRWEPEPRSLVVFALAWGGIGSIGLTLLFDLALTVAAGQRNEFFSAVIQAPVVEEVTKGLGLLLIFAMGRRTFDGPVDGVVYGALVGAGFAFTENIQYFGISLIEGGAGQLTFTFIVRGLFSPFAHAMFTALTGFAIGLAVRRGAHGPGVIGAGAVGAIGAIALHAYWNGSSLLGDFLALYLTTQVPLFVGFILTIVALRREEARLTRERLADYAAAGWFTPQEVVMLATPAGRRTGLQWAATLRGDRRPLMRSFIKDATALAAVRQRAIHGHDAYAAEDERALLMRMRSTRAALLAY
ncbi:PrsW family glutamic-type intramembrane protease [Microbacterium sp.]|uniref:PrsW family glutamic-type intramembrane protease n=1 Tax=Microbacterium sp. TaxID=51671 RepID=UPI00281277BB|nr:PrsW family glutamic-type intramembrane protease [Microbacterium sp.]